MDLRPAMALGRRDVRPSCSGDGMAESLCETATELGMQGGGGWKRGKKPAERLGLCYWAVVSQMLPSDAQRTAMRLGRPTEVVSTIAEDPSQPLRQAPAFVASQP